jgi:hypothetical protein
MWLFFLAIALLVMYFYRSSLKTIAKNMTYRGVEIEGLSEFEKQYPHLCADAKTHLVRFNTLYQKTFDFDNYGVDIINELFSIRDDVLYPLTEIKLRLPNDLSMEKAITRVHEQADRRMLEYVTDVKSRFNYAIFPGQTSSAFDARHYRAANDVVL